MPLVGDLHIFGTNIDFNIQHKLLEVEKIMDSLKRISFLQSMTIVKFNL